MSMNNNDDIKDLLNSLSNKLGSTGNELKQAAQNNDFSGILQKMDPRDAQKVQSILSDKNVTDKILASPQAQMLIKKLLGDKNNG